MIIKCLSVGWMVLLLPTDSHVVTFSWWTGSRLGAAGPSQSEAPSFSSCSFLTSLAFPYSTVFSRKHSHKECLGAWIWKL